MKNLLLLPVLSTLPFCISAQTLRGIVFDKSTQEPLVGATIRLLDIEPPQGAVTDVSGNFTVQNCPNGRQRVFITYFGYQEELMEDVLVTTGKEAVLQVPMEAENQLLEGVVVQGVKKHKAVNKLAKVSANALSMQSVTRYSGGRSDIARMASASAGVAPPGDERNDISVRGNTPTGILWRMDGIAIPNPNHFAIYGNTGGSICALNPNLLGQSDFLTGAFPAEYGNAIAGVMDMHLRSGNKEKYEFLGQIGAWSGVEAVAEGPVARRLNGSFLIGTRYSFADVLSKIGVEPPNGIVPQYGDVCYKFDFSKERHHLDFFGLYGESTSRIFGTAYSRENSVRPWNETTILNGKLGFTGLNYQFLTDSVSYLKATFSYGGFASDLDKREVKPDATTEDLIDEKNQDLAFRAALHYNRRHTKRLTFRTGILLHRMNVESAFRTREYSPDWVSLRQFDKKLNLLEAYAQVQYKVKKRYSVNVGLHVQHLPFNGKTAAEPRFAFKLKLPADNDVVLAYGLHSQVPVLPALLYTAPDGSLPNRDLDFLQSQHWVLGWTKKLEDGWRLRAETYYQWLARVPVQRHASGFSLLNYGSDFFGDTSGALASKGAGKNAGLELTVEKKYKNGFYIIANGSLFDSRYRGSDGIWRNTAYNAHYILNGLMGWEFPGWLRGLTFTADTKISATGGRWRSPILLNESTAAGYEMHDEQNPYSEQYPARFQWDIRLGIRKDGRKCTNHFYLDLTNVTNRKNVAYQYFRRGADAITTQYNFGILPDVLWRITF